MEKRQKRPLNNFEIDLLEWGLQKFFVEPKKMFIEITKQRKENKLFHLKFNEYLKLAKVSSKHCKILEEYKNNTINLSEYSKLLRNLIKQQDLIINTYLTDVAVARFTNKMTYEKLTKLIAIRKQIVKKQKDMGKLSNQELKTIIARHTTMLKHKGDK